MDFFNRQFQIGMTDWVTAILLSVLLTQKCGPNLKKGIIY